MSCFPSIICSQNQTAANAYGGQRRRSSNLTARGEQGNDEAAVLESLDCFASLAMTARTHGSNYREVESRIDLNVIE
jgi:hypothetical protein